MRKNKILILTRYGNLGASSRVRMYQYLPFLEKETNFTISPFFSNTIIDDLYRHKKRNYFLILLAYIKRMLILFKSSSYDIIWIEKELFPYLPGFFESLFLSNKKYFLDYDDAIFHNYDMHPNVVIRTLLKNKLKLLISNANHIFVGNSYLYDYVVKWNSKVTYLFSVVDEKRYIPIPAIKNKIFTIGWIGSPSTSKYLDPIINYLNEITDHYEFCLTTIGASTIYNAKFNICQYNWTLEDEVIQINSFDIGIMPLVNTPWENGKCGFKLIQYMACGVPVIASPVGINSQIVTNEVGFLANCKEDWIKYISVFIENKILREEMGIKSRIRIENDFSFNSNVNIFKNYFTKL